MIADSNGDRSGDTRPLWITGLSSPDSWRSLRQPGYLQLDQVRTPKHCVWGYDRTLKVRNFRSTKVGNFQSQLTTTPQLPAVRALAAEARSNSDAKLILGGPHATLAFAARKMEEKRGTSSRATMATKRLEETFDTIVCGDGETAVLEALSSDAPRVIDADDRKAEHWISRAKVSELPMPARHLLDLDSYHYEIDGHRATSLIGQLGCPFHCGFCGGRNSPSLRISRVRSVDSVVAEVRHIHETYGHTGFMFYDDELNVSSTALDLMRALRTLQLELGVEIRFRGFVKAELFTDQLASAMYQAGFRWILCGFESAHPRILTNIRKRATLEDNTRVLEIAQRHGLKVKALMSIGHPGEFKASVLAAKDWLLTNSVDEFDVTIITPYPGTPYYDEAVEHADLHAAGNRRSAAQRGRRLLPIHELLQGRPRRV